MDHPEPVDLLAFAPHPDDVELCAGGLMLRLADEGRRLVVIDLTRGEASSRGTLASRAEETANATKLMGLVARENLDLPDTGLDASPAMTEPLTEAIRRWRPRVVLSPCPSRWMRQQVRRTMSPRLWLVAPPA